MHIIRNMHPSAANARNTQFKGLPNLNYKLMSKICSLPIKGFEKYGEVQNTAYGKSVFIDNKASILAIAHLDSVQPFTHFDVARLRHDHKIFSPTLDDRAGAYLLLHYLPLLGMNFDILLTEGEEKGRSTAEFFNPPRQYNWMFSFDREGSDVVMYRYKNASITKTLNEFGFKTGQSGIYSDIVALDHLECLGFNFGVGFHDYHTMNSWLSKKELSSQILKFREFWSEYSQIRLPYAPFASTQYRNKSAPKHVGGHGSEDEPTATTEIPLKHIQEAKAVPIEFDAECSQCHKSFKTELADTSSLCPKCKKDNTGPIIYNLPVISSKKKEESKRSKFSSADFVNPNRMSIINTIRLLRPSSTPYKYVKIGKGQYEWRERKAVGFQTQ